MASFPILWRGCRQSYQTQFIRNFPESCGLSHTYLALFYSNSNLINKVLSYTISLLLPLCPGLSVKFVIKKLFVKLVFS